MTAKYRPYQPEDFPRVFAVEQQAFAYPQTEGQLKTLLKGSAICWVADYVKPVIGFVIARVVLDEAELLNIAINPEYHGSEVAENLFLHLIDELKTKGVSSLFLEVRESNTRAIAFYQRNYFQFCGSRTDYYTVTSSEKEDALLMRLQLKDL